MEEVGQSYSDLEGVFSRPTSLTPHKCGPVYYLQQLVYALVLYVTS